MMYRQRGATPLCFAFPVTPITKLHLEHYQVNDIPLYLRTWLFPATFPATSPATYPATPHATSPATSQTTSPATSVATSPVTTPTTSPTTSDTSSYCANRVVDFLQLKETVDKNLGHCSICKKGSLELIERRIDCFSSTFEIYCENCEKTRKNS